MAWYGADPGGRNCFGLARLSKDGKFKTTLVSSVDESMDFIEQPTAIGIDCPLWWSSGKGGGRKADRWLRETYGIHPGTVQTVNALRGAVVVQGILLAMRVRARNPNVLITETHPKALLKALKLRDWKVAAKHFRLDRKKPATEHERDAILSAVAAREGARRKWTHDLSIKRNQSELDPKEIWFGPVNYWWPH